MAREASDDALIRAFPIFFLEAFVG
jgi:hypothetical protein